MDRYDRAEKLGEGISSVVYKALDKHRNVFVALKTIGLENEEEGIPSTAIREIAILNTLQHPNVIKMHDVVHHERGLIIALEFVPFNLRQWLDNNEVQPQIVREISSQLFQSLEYCHRMNVVHRDLKPHNILVQPTETSITIKLADFGLSRQLGIHVRTCTSEVVTLWYRPPDVLCGSQTYGMSVDIWSAACIMAELCTKTPTFPGSDNVDTLRKMYELLGTPNEEIWPECAELPNYVKYSQQIDNYQAQQIEEAFPQVEQLVGSNGINLLEMCWMFQSTKRPTAKKALSHPYFTS